MHTPVIKCNFEGPSTMDQQNIKMHVFQLLEHEVAESATGALFFLNGKVIVDFTVSDEKTATTISSQLAWKV